MTAVRRNRWRELLVDAPAVLAFGLFPLWVYALLQFGAWWHSVPSESFTPEAWTVADAGRRGRMVRALDRSGVLNGKTCGEVRALLGEPDTATGEVWSYFVGSGGYDCASAWSYFLNLRLDERGQVREVSIDD